MTILLLVGGRNNNQVKQSDCPLATRDQLWVPDILSDSPTLIVRLKGSSNCRSGALQANRTDAGRFGFDLGWQDSVTTRTAPPAVDEQFLQWDVLPLGEKDKVRLLNTPHSSCLLFALCSVSCLLFACCTRYFTYLAFVNACSSMK